MIIRRSILISMAMFYVVTTSTSFVLPTFIITSKARTTTTTRFQPSSTSITGSSQHRRDRMRRPGHDTFVAAKQPGNSKDGGADSVRRTLLGLTVPLTVALVANAPFLALMSKPPTSNEREEMLSEWCKGDYCTLLGGGSGYNGESSSEGVYDGDFSKKLPSSEEYEAQARIAAELLSNE